MQFQKAAKEAKVFLLSFLLLRLTFAEIANLRPSQSSISPASEELKQKKPRSRNDGRRKYLGILGCSLAFFLPFFGWHRVKWVPRPEAKVEEANRGEANHVFDSLRQTKFFSCLFQTWRMTNKIIGLTGWTAVPSYQGQSTFVRRRRDGKYYRRSSVGNGEISFPSLGKSRRCRWTDPSVGRRQK